VMPESLLAEPVLVEPVLVEPVLVEELGVDDVGVVTVAPEDAVAPVSLVPLVVVVEPAGVVLLVDVPLASAVCATPATRPNVTAAADTAAAAAAMRPRTCSRLGVCVGFIPMTMRRRGSGGPHHNVKNCSSLAGTG
jgi:hypothetical protein